ncbi:MAG TPA: hypothetical protein VJ843_02500 [Candidatus Saccharimonadales bacterium]|nr:hypothetical protein [Candidatus Saccharimonadales bacterium]
MENKNPVHEGHAKFPGAFSLFGSSLAIITKNIETFLALILGPLALLVVGMLFGLVSDLNRDNQMLQAVVSFIVFVMVVAAGALYFMVAPALVVTQLRGAFGAKIEPREAIRTGLPFFWRLLGLGILLTIIFLVSLALLVVPFFFMYKRYILAPYYLVHYNLGITEAMRKSADDAKRFSSPLWGLVGVTFLIEIIPFANGILSILYSCAPAARFKEIVDARSEHSQSDSKTTDDASEVVDVAPKDPVS